MNGTLRIFGIQDPAALVKRYVELGSIHLPSPSELRARKERDKEHQHIMQRLCMARLRAEREGEDTAKFPKRVRKPYAKRR